MDGPRFDRLTRSFAGISRRGLLKGALGLAASAAGIGASDVAASRVCRGLGQRCGNGGQCCSGACAKDPALAGKPGNGPRVCVCTRPDDCPQPAGACEAATCAGGVCGVGPAVGRPCDDGDVCTAAETCQADGSCRGTLLPPAITCPASFTTAATGDGCTATASYTLPAATCGGVVTCSPVPGALLAAGPNLVTCTAANGGGSTPCTFTITVVDDSPPAIACPPDQQPALIGGLSGPVTYPAPTATDSCGGASVSCSPASGSVFAAGVATAVTCTATNPAGLQSSCGFTVTPACAPDCAGRACGAPDGCGGICQTGSCPDGGPCVEAGVCNAGFCQYPSKPAFTPCGDQSGCRRDVCNGGGVCVESYAAPGTDCGDACTFGQCTPDGTCLITGTVPCLEEPFPLCRQGSGTCNPATGTCDYPPLAPGVTCFPSAPTNYCLSGVCDGAGGCQNATERVCGGGLGCQSCDPLSGACVPVNFFETCDGARGICDDAGTCGYPCGAGCKDACYERLDPGLNRTGDYFCCALLDANGNCCWINDKYGVVDDDGACRADPDLPECCQGNPFCPDCSFGGLRRCC